LLLTSVDPVGADIPPLTFRTMVEGRESGIVKQPLGQGDGPFELVVATLASNGLRSRLSRLSLAE
jgi:hypothetical protein